MCIYNYSKTIVLMFVSFQWRIDGLFVFKNDICVTLNEISTRKNSPYFVRSRHTWIAACAFIWCLHYCTIHISYIYSFWQCEVFRNCEGEICWYECIELKYDCYVLELHISFSFIIHSGIFFSLIHIRNVVHFYS